MRLTFSKKQIPHLVVLAVAALFLALTAGWPYETYLFPRLICCVVLFTVLISLYAEMHADKKDSADSVRNAWLSSSMAEDRTALVKTSMVVIWMFLYILAIRLVGYEVASVAFIFLFMKFQGKQTWGVAILAALLCFAFVMLVFDWGLGIKWPDGLLQEMLKQ